MFRRFLIAFVLFALPQISHAQDLWDRAKTTIGGKSVAIEYGRPRLNGRTLAELMNQLPADRIWRAGSGPMTVLSTDTDLLIGGKKVPAGDYSLYMYCPEQGDYALIINRDLGQQPPGSRLERAAPDRANRDYPHFMSYTADIADKEVVRVPLKHIASGRSEILIYAFQPGDAGAVLTISWGDQAWVVEFQPAP